MNYKHFIITRFNLTIFKEDKKKNPVLTDKWLEERFKLFEMYCFPSLTSQTNTIFNWLCLFDEDTPKKFKSKISEYKNEFPQFIPLFLSHDETLNLEIYLRNEIKKYISPKDSYLITTRIDNDDSFHKEIVNIIQEQVKKDNGEKYIYNFDYGFQYFEEYNYLQKIFYRNNHFLTRVDNLNDDFGTIMSFRHDRIDKDLKVNNLNNKLNPLWIEVVHGSNVANDIKYTLTYPQIKNMDLAQFGLNIKIRSKESLNSLIFKIVPRLFNQTIKKIWNKIIKLKQKK